MEEEDYELKDYDLLWNVTMAESNTEISQLLRNNAMNCLLKLIINQNILLKGYIVKAMEIINSNYDPILYAMNYLKSVLYESKNKDKYLNALKESGRILERVLKSITKYKEKVNEIMNSEQSNANIMQQVIYLRLRILIHFILMRIV